MEVRFILASPSFSLRHRPAASFPIIIGAEAGVFEPGQHFLRELFLYRDLSIGTLKDAAGIICLWLRWIHQQGGDWVQPRADDFIDWVRRDADALQLTPARLQRRAEVIFSFYEHLDRNSRGTAAIAHFVGELAAPLQADSKTGRLKVKRTLRLSFKGVASRHMRPTPSAEEVRKIGQTLLRDGVGYEPVRNWLLVETAYETNLRMQGLAQLSLDHLSQLLRSRGIISSNEDVEISSPTSEYRSRLRSSLDRLEGSGLSALIVHGIQEKRRVRSVRFPIFLIRQILDYAWGERAQFVKLVEQRGGSADNSLWLSWKTGLALRRGSIGDVLADGFKAAGVPGSGHRLRAAHCVRMFRWMLRMARERGATKFDTETLLERGAELMGQSDPRSLRPYLTAVTLEDLALLDDVREPSLLGSLGPPPA